MKYRELDRLPAGKTRKKGRILRLVEGLDGVLVLDAFMDGQYFGRYAQVVKTGEYAAKRENEKLWHTWKIDAFLNERKYTYWMESPKDWRFENEKQQRKVQELTGSHAEKLLSAEGIIRNISSEEYRYNSKKRSRAYDRKVERVNELMAAVPDVPEDFEQWWLSTCEGVKDEEYVFYDKEKEIYHCTACGKNHVIAKAKHRQDYICEKSGKRTTVIRRQKSIRHDDYAMAISPVNDEWSAERLFKMIVVFNSRGKFVYFKENIRVMLSRTGKKTKIYYSQSSWRDDYGFDCGRRDSDWWDTNPANKRWNSAYLYPPKQEDLTGTQAENLHLPQMAAAGVSLNWNGIIFYAEKTACFEYLLKLGLTRLAAEESSSLYIWSGLNGIQTSINLDGTNAVEILGMDKQRINRLRQVNGGSNTMEWLRMEYDTGKKISQKALLLAEQKNIRAEYYTFIMDRMSPEQVINYVAAQKEKGNSKSDYYISSDWKDYLAMAQRLHMDVYDSIVYKPKNLEIRHDMLVEEIARRGDDMWTVEIAAKYPDIEKIYREIKEKYEYANKDYVMVVPQDIKDIVNDGRVLHHCAASSERYFDRINKRECFLLFVRKKSTPDEPWYTMEIQPGGTIRQKRTRFNRQDDEEEVVKFLREWQKAIKKRLTREDMELEEQSSIQREIEQMELLQKGDEKSLRVWQELENDFMENSTVAPAHPVMAAG